MDFQDPISRWRQIHLCGVVVSRRNRRAGAILTGSHLRRNIKTHFNPHLDKLHKWTEALFFVVEGAEGDEPGGVVRFGAAVNAGQGVGAFADLLALAHEVHRDPG